MKSAIIRLALLIMSFSLLLGCSREEFMDLYGFTDRFTYSQITPEDFYTDKTDDGKMIYYTYFEKENPKAMLKLICTENGKIDEIRIYLTKYDKNGKRTDINTEDILLFTKLISSSICAFTGWSEATAEDIITQMSLYEKKSYESEGELTKTKAGFHFIYHSAELGSEFIIYNTCLKTVPETEKPESRPMYGDTTKIRTETVPVK